MTEEDRELIRDLTKSINALSEAIRQQRAPREVIWNTGLTIGREGVSGFATIPRTCYID